MFAWPSVGRWLCWLGSVFAIYSQRCWTCLGQSRSISVHFNFKLQCMAITHARSFVRSLAIEMSVAQIILVANCKKCAFFADVWVCASCKMLLCSLRIDFLPFSLVSVFYLFFVLLFVVFFSFFFFACLSLFGSFCHVFVSLLYFHSFCYLSCFASYYTTAPSTFQCCQYRIYMRNRINRLIGKQRCLCGICCFRKSRIFKCV